MAEINAEATRSNYMGADRGTSGDNGKKKKMIIGGVVGVVVLVIVIVIIVLATGGSKPKPPVPPPPSPNDPQNYQEENNMYLGTTVQATPYAYTVTLKQQIPKPPAPTTLEVQADAKDVYTPVNPTAIPAGVVNNMWADTVRFNVTLASQNMAHLLIYDDAKAEFMTPTVVFDRPPQDNQTSLQNTLNTTTDATSRFVFQILDRSTGKQLFSTEKRKFVI